MVWSFGFSMEESSRGHPGGSIILNPTVDLERRAAAEKSLGVVVFLFVEREKARQNSIIMCEWHFERAAGVDAILFW